MWDSRLNGLRRTLAKYKLMDVIRNTYVNTIMTGL